MSQANDDSSPSGFTNLDHEKMRLTHKFYKQSVNQLRDLLKSNKIFLNMVIHDCRNPTNQIKFAIDMALTTIRKVEAKTFNLEGMVLQLTDSMLKDFKEIVAELILENKNLKTKLIRMQALILENEVKNSLLERRIYELEKENRILKNEVSKCSCRTKQHDYFKIDQIYEFYKKNAAMYNTGSKEDLKQETIRTEMVEVESLDDDEEELKIA